MGTPITLRIELYWMNGVLADDEPVVPMEPQYELLDHRTGKALREDLFMNCRELEDYIAAHHPGSERAALPSAPPEEARMAERALALMDKPPPGFDTLHLRPGLAGQYYQWSHAPETTARLRRALGLPDAGR